MATRKKSHKYLNQKYLELSLDHLYFPAPLDRTIINNLFLTNTMNQPVAFKIMTTQQKRYTVKPRSGIIQPFAHEEIKITLKPIKEHDAQLNDKFKIESALIREDELHVDKDDLWKQLAGSDEPRISEERLACVFENPPSDANITQVILNDGSIIVSAPAVEAQRRAEPEPEHEQEPAHATGLDTTDELLESLTPSAQSGYDRDVFYSMGPDSVARHEEQMPRESKTAVEPPVEPAVEPVFEQRDAFDSSLRNMETNVNRLFEAPQEQQENLVHELEMTIKNLTHELQQSQNLLRQREGLVSTMQSTIKNHENMVGEMERKLKEKDKKLMEKKEGRDRRATQAVQPVQTAPMGSNNIVMLLIVAVIAFVLGKLMG